MYGEYGYMEEGPLGKPYNLRLLRRLARYAIPYRRIILLALFLSIFITLLDLALPYLSKIAIDRYILSSWYRIDLSTMQRTGTHDFIKEYGHLLERSEDGAYGLISHIDIKKIDPALLHELRNKGIVSQDRYYKIRPNAQEPSNFIQEGKPDRKMMSVPLSSPLKGLTA